ncbi:MAG: sigma-70 family RNA polymerase sigma factor [Saprospiraceae bacterium]
MQNIKEYSGGGERYVYPKTNADFKLLYTKLKAYARLKLFNRYPILKPVMEDLFHDAMISLITDIMNKRFEGRSSVESYFATIFLRKCHKAHKELKPEESYEEEENVNEELYGAEALPEEKRQAVLNCIELLPDGEKEVIVFHYFNQYGYEVISLRTGLSEQTIRNRASKAYKKLLTCIRNSPAFKD